MKTISPGLCRQGQVRQNSSLETLLNSVCTAFLGFPTKMGVIGHVAKNLSGAFRRFPMCLFLFIFTHILNWWYSDHHCLVAQPPITSKEHSNKFEVAVEVVSGELTPRKINHVPQKRNYFNRKYIFQPSFFRGYVSFQGGRESWGF